METLELKHLAPYLPYGLNVMIWNGDAKPYIREMTELKTYTRYVFASVNSKPLLKPLSDLMEDEETISTIINESWIAGEYRIIISEVRISIEDEDNDVLSIWLQKPHCNMEWVNDILYANHYDLKFLIEQGLALDLKTIETSKAV